MKSTIGLLQNEIEEAIKIYVNARIQSGYKHKFSEVEVGFNVSDMNGRITCDVTMMVEPNEPEGAKE